MSTSTVEPEELALLLAWIEAYGDSSAQLKLETAAQAVALWSDFNRWYDPRAVAALAAEAASLSTVSQQYAAGATLEYMAGVAAIAGATDAATGAVGVTAPLDALAIIRNAAPLLLVHTRPSEVYKRAIAEGQTEERAVELALARAENLVITDLTLQERAVEFDMLGRLGITEYRRIIHPELSQTGTCGLCIAAADRRYTTGELRPIHDRCCCTVMPIVGDHDPGAELNGQSLTDLYKSVAAESDGLDPASLKNVRYVVREHGEYGPVLVRRDDKFRGPDQVQIEKDQARAARMLAKVAPTLAAMEADPDTDPAMLADVRDRYDRLRAIVPDDFDT